MATDARHIKTHGNDDATNAASSTAQTYGAKFGNCRIKSRTMKRVQRYAEKIASA